MRRMDKIFKAMADFVGSRAADQCRSHHQKMEKKFKSFYNIIYSLRMDDNLTLDVEKMREDMRNFGIEGEFNLIEPEVLSENRKKIEKVAEAERVEEEKENGKVERELEMEKIDDSMGYGDNIKSYDLMEESINEPLI